MASLFVIASGDNVATALEEVFPGEAAFTGEAAGTLLVRERIAKGHKVSLRTIRQGTPVVKHGHPMAVAVRDIAEGEWVHSHNVRSLYDRK